MPANECVALKTPAEIVTGQCVANVTGKRFVKIGAPRVGGGIEGGTSAVSSPFPGSIAAVLSTDTDDVYQITPCSVQGEAALGVAQYDQAATFNVPVYKLGVGHVLPITAGSNITAGQEIMTDANGKAIPWVSPTATNATPLPVAKALGYALDSASSGNDCEIALY